MPPRLRVDRHEGLGRGARVCGSGRRSVLRDSTSDRHDRSEEQSKAALHCVRRQLALGEQLVEGVERREHVEHVGGLVSNPDVELRVHGTSRPMRARGATNNERPEL